VGLLEHKEGWIDDGPMEGFWGILRQNVIARRLPRCARNDSQAQQKGLVPI